MAIVVIYIVLGILYESFTQPLVILSGLPAAGFGALLTLMLFKTELSLYAFVGIIMLVGLVKKNGIMMVDFAAVAERDHGKSPLEAIHEACLVRFRPIMMTTMCALVGTLPIALGLGAGAEARRPLGLAVVGGLLVSQFLTLYITPVYYVYIEGARLRLVKKKAKSQDDMEASGRVGISSARAAAGLDFRSRFHSRGLESGKPRPARGVGHLEPAVAIHPVVVFLGLPHCHHERRRGRGHGVVASPARSGVAGQARADPLRHRGGRPPFDAGRSLGRSARYPPSARRSPSSCTTPPGTCISNSPVASGPRMA